MMKVFKKLTVVMMIAVLSTTIVGCGESVPEISREEAHEAAAKWYDVENEYHADIEFSEIEPREVNRDELLAKISKFKSDYESDADEAVIIEDLDEMVAVMDFIGTEYWIQSIRYDMNPNDETANNKMLEIYDINVDYYDQCCIAIREALKGKNKDIIIEHLGNDDLVDSFLEYEDMTREQKDRVNKIEELKSEYQNVSVYPAPFTYDGKQWTREEYLNAYNAGELSYDEMIELDAEYYKDLNSQICEIYLQMIPLLNEHACDEGYDNYAELSFNEYVRDYTTEDLQSLYASVKKYIVPLVLELTENSHTNYELNSMDLSEEEKISKTEDIIQKLDPALLDAWYYFTDHHMYDLDYSETKMDTGYTIKLNDYGAPFIFDEPYLYYEDLFTVIHEFGHYNNMFHDTTPALYECNNMDTSEIHSQTLELLSFEYADELFGRRNSVDARRVKLTSICEAVVNGCLFDEFQHEVFSYEGELTTEELNRMFMTLSKQYGNSYQLYENGDEAYYWVMVDHTFSAPMYYISYATSALAALDIWGMSIENRDLAVECYLNTTAYGSDVGFRELLNDAGLPDVFDEEVIADLSVVVGDYVDNNLNPNHYYIVIIEDYLMICSPILLPVIILLIWLLVRAGKRKKAGLNRTEQYVRLS